jgi:hypothetical protein
MFAPLILSSRQVATPSGVISLTSCSKSVNWSGGSTAPNWKRPFSSSVWRWAVVKSVAGTIAATAEASSDH